MSPLTLNPFQQWLNKLEADKEYLVTHEILLDLKELVNSEVNCLSNIDDAFKVVKYLADNKAVVLTQHEDKSFTIKKNL